MNSCNCWPSAVEIETLDPTTLLGIFNEFLDQLRAAGRFEDYRTELMADMALAGVAPLLNTRRQ